MISGIRDSLLDGVSRFRLEELESRILGLEDSEENQDIYLLGLGGCFDNFNHRIRELKQGQDNLEKLDKDRFDTIIRLFTVALNLEKRVEFLEHKNKILIYCISQLVKIQVKTGEKSVKLKEIRDLEEDFQKLRID